MFKTSTSQWILFALLVCFPRITLAAEPSPQWTGWVEAAGYFSSNQSRAEAVYFQPLAQTENSLLFADIRAKLFTEDIREGNFAVGYREIINNDWIVGAWIGYDHRRSSFGNTFNQISAGFETMNPDFDFRLNTYMPLSDPKSTSATAQVVFTGSQLYMISGAESPMHGIDSEFGVRLPIERFGFENSQEARLFFGGYFFDDTNLPRSIIGPRIRTEFRMFDLEYLGAGSRLTIEAELQHDHIRNNQAELGVRLRIPLFDGQPSRYASTDPLVRRMTEGLERDTDIVTIPSGPELLVNAATGALVDNVITVDATDNLRHEITHQAGSNTLIIVDGSAGQIESSVRLRGEQTFAGGGTILRLKGAESGTLTSWKLPGTRPTLTPPRICGLQGYSWSIITFPRIHYPQDQYPGSSIPCSQDDYSLIFVDGQKVHIDGVDLDGKGFSSGIEGGTPLHGVVATLVDISTCRYFDTAFQGSPCRTIQTVSAHPAGFVVENTRIRGTAFFGVYIGDDSTATLENVSIQTIRSYNLTTPTFSPSAIFAHNRNSIRISDSTISGIPGTAISLNNDNVLNLNQTSISNISGSEIEANDRNVIDVLN